MSLISLQAGTEAAATPQSSGFVEYQNPEYGFTVQYPSDWSVDEEAFERPGGYGIIAGFLGSIGWVSIGIGEVDDPSKTLQDYMNSHISAYQGSLTDFEVIEATADATLAGRPAYRLVYTELLEQVPYRVTELGTKIGDSLYVVIIMSEEDDFSAHLPIAQQVVDSLQIGSEIQGTTDQVVPDETSTPLPQTTSDTVDEIINKIASQIAIANPGINENDIVQLLQQLAANTADPSQSLNAIAQEVENDPTGPVAQSVINELP